ncbi:MAG TPA: hypothetical protein VJ792_08375 [Candidatus Nitrosotalea sp.]|nr:hypothetical protein [Candidatus Nitrosotalea sp.]
MIDEKHRKQLGIKAVAVVFALLLVAIGAATTIHPVYADNDCGDDCGDGCIVNAAGISVCTSVRTPGGT